MEGTSQSSCVDGRSGEQAGEIHRRSLQEDFFHMDGTVWCLPAAASLLHNVGPCAGVGILGLARTDVSLPVPFEDRNQFAILCQGRRHAKPEVLQLWRTRNTRGADCHL